MTTTKRTKAHPSNVELSDRVTEFIKRMSPTERIGCLRLHGWRNDISVHSWQHPSFGSPHGITYLFPLLEAVRFHFAETIVKGRELHAKEKDS